jgi:hypothetical protein
MMNLLSLSTLELRQICYFLKVVAEGNNFSRAADQLHIGQPPLTQRIQALEKKLGVILFDRRRRPAQLTQAGHWDPSWADERGNPWDYTEIMNPIIPKLSAGVTGEARLSRISIGVLADLGYSVDFNAADPFGRQSSRFLINRDAMINL